MTCRYSLPSRFLSVKEAAELLSGCISADIEYTLPVRLVDCHPPSTVEAQLEGLLRNNVGVALLVFHERTSGFLFRNNTIIYVDTHFNPPAVNHVHD